MKKIFIKLENLFGKLTIRNKFISIFTLLLFVLAIFIITYFPKQLEKEVYSSAKEKLSTISEHTAYSIIPALYFNDKEALENLLIGIIRIKSILFIVIKSDKDSIIYSYNLQKSTSYNYSVKEVGIYISDDVSFMESYTPVYEDNKLLGKLYIGMSLDEINERITKSRGSIAIISLASLIVGFLMIFILSSFVVVPLNKLTTTIEEISKGDLTQRAFISSEDEVGKLGTSFNLMLEKLERAYNELHDEIKVRKEAEEKLIKAKEEVSRALEQEKELNELRNRFISMVSHEYRTPLTAILSSTYLLDIFYKKGLTSEFEKQIKVIQSSVNDMTQLLEDVLALGKLEAEVKLNKNDVVDLSEIVNEQIIITNVIDKSNHRIIFNKNLSNSQIKSNKKAMVQIINNLLSNSTKYSPAGSRIDIDLFEKNSYIMLSIKDEGIGIEKDDLEDIFQPFIRGNNVGIIQSTGLGLSIVKKTVDALGYVILVESESGKGSKFTLLIPKSIC